MAENESLDLGQRGARRWLVVFNAIRKGEPLPRVVEKVRKRLYDGLRHALKDLADIGISLVDLLSARDSPPTLRHLVKQSMGHEYADLFAQTALAESGNDCEGVLEAFVRNIWDKISDQVALNAVGTGLWTNLVDLQIRLNSVGDEIVQDFQRIAFKLAKDPTWQPRTVGKRGEGVDRTTETLGMSLLGIRKE